MAKALVANHKRSLAPLLNLLGEGKAKTAVIDNSTFSVVLVLPIEQK
jgi:hypothetical protein